MRRIISLFVALLFAVVAFASLDTDPTYAEMEKVRGSVKTPLLTMIGIVDPDLQPVSITFSFRKPDGSIGEIIFSPRDTAWKRIERVSIRKEALALDIDVNEIEWVFSPGTVESDSIEWTNPENIGKIRLESGLFVLTEIMTR